MTSQTVSDYSPTEEKLNVYSHALGVILSVIGLVLLLLKSQAGNAPQIIAYGIYAVSMVLLYLASTLYHAATKPKKRKRLKILDHAAIYLLIAGTYTPYCLLTLDNKDGIPLLIAVWTVAALGIVLKLFFTGRFNLLSTLLYVAMGWMVVFAYEGILNNLALEGLQLLGAGGIAYTVGAVLYSIKKIPFNHAIFHVFVLLGSLFHFASIYGYVG